MRCSSLAISHAKRFFKGTYHHFCKIHIQRYLDEFCYRWNRRHLEKQLATHLIGTCALHRARLPASGWMLISCFERKLQPEEQIRSNRFPPGLFHQESSSARSDCQQEGLGLVIF
ncbi:MAG: transposase [Candidatus Obscuribacterales bacterium]|nr:transposase [Candidatus Obscuribacterales bacterium]